MVMETQKIILLIDDDIRNIFALELTLKARKYRFLSAQNATEGLQLLQRNSDIGLVLLDMMMPEMDGYEAIQRIRSSDKYGHVPIVAVTANAMNGDREKCLAAGADNYVAKPIDVDRLMNVIEELLQMIELDIVKNDDMEMLLKDISHLYGYDFTPYSKASLKRRLNRICMLDKFTSFAELRYRLIHDGAYLSRFIEEITVNVTEMFRDPHFYATLRHHILPVLRTYPFIRIWVAGCSTG